MAQERSRLVPCVQANDWIDGRWRGKADGRSPVCNSVGHMLKDGMWWHRADSDDVLSSSQQDPVPAPDLTGASSRVLTVRGYVIEEARVPRGYLWFVGGSFLLSHDDMLRAHIAFGRTGKSTFASALIRDVNDISIGWKRAGCLIEYTQWAMLP